MIAFKGFNYDLSYQDNAFLTTTYVRHLNFTSSLIYRVLADYSCNYYRILPKCSVKYVVIMRGGKGLGTELRILTTRWIKGGSFDFVVDEPDPGKIITVRCRRNNIVITYNITPVRTDNTLLSIRLLVPINASPNFLKLFYKRMLCSFLLFKHIRLMERLLKSKSKMKVVFPPYYAACI